MAPQLMHWCVIGISEEFGLRGAHLGGCGARASELVICRSCTVPGSGIRDAILRWS
jgi:hypothetical protein